MAVTLTAAQGGQSHRHTDRDQRDDDDEQLVDALVAAEGDREAVEGRPARHYTLSLSELPPAGDAATQPLSLTGDLWVDEANAVRLTGSLEGILGSEGYRRKIELQVVRTAIGMPQNIEPPDPSEEDGDANTELRSP